MGAASRGVRRSLANLVGSAALGGTLLAMGFGRQSNEEEGSRLLRDTPKPSLSRKAHYAWSEVVRLLYGAIGKHRVVSIAAGVTFFTLLAIFPAVGALVSIYALVADPASIQAHLSDLSAMLPGGAIEVIGDQLSRVSSGGKSTLGTAFLFSFALSIWSANAGMKALFDALNIVYDATDRRGLIKLNLISLAFTAAAIFGMLLVLGAVVVLPSALEYLGVDRVGNMVLRFARWPALYVLVALALAFLYRFGPDRENAQWHWITWGSAAASLLWIVASITFSLYAANFGTYNKTYGSLGAVVGFMTWIWISAMVVLAGGEIDAIMERLDRGTAK